MHYKLPSGQLLEIDSKIQTNAPELLFEGLEPNSAVPNMINEVYLECPVDARKELLQNIILAGGSTCFQNFDERLQYELYLLTKQNKIQIFPENSQSPRKLKNWIGASISAQL